MCLHDFALDQPAAGDVYEANVLGQNGGLWGGSCTCPDGSVYLVGDSADYCGSLACVGGASGTCNKWESDAWRQKSVTCGLPKAKPALLLRVTTSQAGHARVWTAEGRLSMHWDAMLNWNEGQTDTVLRSSIAASDMCTFTHAEDGGDSNLCFEVRGETGSTYDNILYQGCCPDALQSMRGGAKRIELEGGATLSFHVPFLIPPSPPPPPPPRSPPRPPLPHPEYNSWPGNLDAAKCHAFLRDPAHIFRAPASFEPCPAPTRLASPLTLPATCPATSRDRRQDVGSRRMGQNGRGVGRGALRVLAAPEGQPRRNADGCDLL